MAGPTCSTRNTGRRDQGHPPLTLTSERPRPRALGCWAGPSLYRLSELLGTHTAMLDLSFWTSLDFLISSLQSASSFTQKGWLEGKHRTQRWASREHLMMAATPRRRSLAPGDMHQGTSTPGHVTGSFASAAGTDTRCLAYSTNHLPRGTSPASRPLNRRAG